MATNDKILSDETRFAIKAIGGSMLFPLYATRELAEKDLHALPDSYTDYEHYEIVEVPMVTKEESLRWTNFWKRAAKSREESNK